MAREDRIQQWMNIAEEDFNVAEYLVKGGKWLYAVFECHQTLEKMLKAYWCATREDEPPYTHSHIKLLDGCELTKELTKEQIRFIEILTPMYIAARYPEHKRKMASSLNEQSSQYILENTQKMKQWIHERLSANRKPLISQENTNE